MKRRTFVGAVGAVGATASLSGCLSGGGGTSLENHPAGRGIANQPSLGPEPSDASGVIVAFEDPSCPSCARFELNVFPKLKRRLVDTGEASFVFRGIPVVKPWSETAVPAMEAAFGRDEGAFWTLKQLYYQNQRQISSQNVQNATRQLLGKTSVDASAVLNDVNEGTYSDEVDTDYQASQDAEVQGTPTFHLFKDGSHVTEIVGPQSVETFENALK